MTKNNKGITMITLIVTILVISIIAGVTIYQSVENIKARKIDSLYTDLELLEDKVNTYYLNNGSLPIKEEFKGSDNFKSVRNVNDNDVYYVIDISKLEGVSLSMKLDFTGDDVYIMNEQTHTVYYPKGLTIDNETYYILPKQYSKIVGNITEEVQIGDYVDYDPTVADKNGTPVDPTKLTYTSPIGSPVNTDDGLISPIIPSGTATEHGNGYGNQVFTAEKNIEWQILSIDKVTGEIEITLAKDSYKPTITISREIGYIYAEQEINEVCAIYGYGYGANTSIGADYTIGKPGEDENKRIEGTGARSIDLKYILNLTGGSQELKNSIKDEDLLEILSDKYVLASRSYKENGKAYSIYQNIFGDRISTPLLCQDHGEEIWSEVTSNGIKPIVTLKPNVIDLTVGDGSSEKPWGLK